MILILPKHCENKMVFSKITKGHVIQHFNDVGILFPHVLLLAILSSTKLTGRP